MHSILESDGVSSDPYEALCHMGTLIIEGRTPNSIGDSAASGEAGVKSAKPYTEGPHCPNFMKFHNKDTHNVHKCTENNMLCIRYNNLKQHLQSLQVKASSVSIEVSLGPDCLCGELRSQSTLVSTQPSKRDVILEQWTITLGHKRMQEPSSQMSVLNLYQAVRSLLHFSQLTAWYMCNSGMKPAHVIYRVGVPDDSTFISDENFVSHDFPVADVNKTVWMKISVKTLPRMEKIPSVYCPQHPSSTVDLAQGSHFDGKEGRKSNKDKIYLSSEPLHPNFGPDEKCKLLESALPLKFQGVRKKTLDVQERKRKKLITMFSSRSPLGIENCSGVEFFDGMIIDEKKMSPHSEFFGNKRMFQDESLKHFQGESSKTDYKKSKSCAFPTELPGLVKPSTHFDVFSCDYFAEKVVGLDDPTLGLMVGLESLSDSKRKSDFRTKGKMKMSICNAVESNSESLKKKSETKTVIDILDDRMQISCAISGKHHCKWECEEENDLNNAAGNVEKPKRRRSLSKARGNEVSEDVKLGGSDSEKILHGKFKEIDSYKEECSPLREQETDKPEGSHSYNKTFISSSDFPQPSHSSKTFHLESPPKPKICTNVDTNDSLGGSTIISQTPKIESLPLNEMRESEADLAGHEEWEEENGVESVKGNESGSSRRETSPEGKQAGNLNWVRTESFESFRRGCVFSSNYASENSSDSECELSDSHLEPSNPFLAAILRTTRKSASKKDWKIHRNCDNNIKNKCCSDYKEQESCDRAGRSKGSVLLLEKLKDPIKNYMNEKMVKAKVGACDQIENSFGDKFIERVGCRSHETHGKNLDLRMTRRKSSAMRSSRDLVGESALGDTSNSSELLSKSLSRLKSLFDKQDLKEEERISDGLFEESGSNNLNSIKTIPVPSAHDKLKFRRSLDSAAQLVFHRCSGLPLTSSPAPVRRNNNSFSFDSSLNSVSAIKSALFEPANSLSSEDENESEGSLKSPASPGAWLVGSKPINYHSLSPLPLLGSFEESVLNGRLEPVSTVQGFTAELGASGPFCPRHLYLPVTVFFYTLGDNDKVSAPYLGHINLGKKGYNVPRSGTIQVTLFNPLRTVVKMFVVVYDLHDMPINSHTFLRQRTLYVPASQKESTYTDKKETPFEQEDYHKYLRYLIHLRFVSGKTGRIYLHTDIRMVIFRKADEDTATALGNQSDGETYELRSHTHGPINPKFSPRK